MLKIFTYLAAFALAITGATLAEGLGLVPLENGRTVHFLFGLLSALAVMLVCGIVVTYFIGTSRWCREVVETYELDESLLRRSTRLKRRTFPWALLAMLTALAMVATGAGADPGNTLVAATGRWAGIHRFLTIGGTALLAACFFVQWNNLREQFAVIEDVLSEVRRIRLERGLEI